MVTRMFNQVLVLFSVGWTVSMSLPVQVNQTLPVSTMSYGETLNKERRTVNSPFYGTAYPNNVDIEWSIKPPASHFRVFLDFLDFQLQDCPGCSCDSLTVIDGNKPTSPILGTFCGFVLPPSFASFGHVMTLKFHSDNQTSYNGFLASYHFITD
ncbi:CUB domain-containing protein 2-like [Pelobates fuscus]|uniref:CUB domain-containing protein 2-like n=1 Tax=Pelobates fuscus TaxID=191477 RepID=UPI002FE46419